MGTPIINPPQSAILGMHATKMRAVVGPDVRRRCMLCLEGGDSVRGCAELGGGYGGGRAMLFPSSGRIRESRWWFDFHMAVFVPPFVRNVETSIHKPRYYHLSVGIYPATYTTELYMRLGPTTAPGRTRQRGYAGPCSVSCHLSKSSVSRKWRWVFPFLVTQRNTDRVASHVSIYPKNSQPTVSL